MRPVRIPAAIVAFARLKGQVLRGTLAKGGPPRAQLLAATAASLMLGMFGLLVLVALGRGAVIADDVLVVFLPVTVLGVGLLSAATGVDSAVDPRSFASEPISQWHLGLGMLVTAVVGPPGLLALFAGVGIIGGWFPHDGGAAAFTVAAVLAWWASLLLCSRTLANLLGAVATTRFRQLAHAGATIASLGALFITQLLAADPESWDASRWSSMASVARWSPPGQLALAITEAHDSAEALPHLLIGISWLPVLVVVAVVSTKHLALSSPRPGGGGRGSSRWFLRETTAARPFPGGRLSSRPAVEALGARTLLTKVRTPRQVVNSITALAVGGAVYVIAPLLGAFVDPRLVILAGAIHFAVLFDGNNAFGMDGPAIWSEILAGADSRVLVWGKVRSSLLIMTVPGFVLPVVLAAMTGGWRWVPAGWLVAIGSVTAAAGVAVLSAVLAPFALPDSPNPLAGGDTGQGCLAGLMLTASVLLLGLVSAPVGLGIWFASRYSAPTATLVAVAAPVLGVITLWGCVQLARLRIADREAELLARVTTGR